MITKRKELFYTCEKCGFKFSNLDLPRTCSNCFACTGCEIYICPECENEVVIQPMGKMKTSGLNGSDLIKK